MPITAAACSRVIEGNYRKNSSSGTPAARESNRFRTGTRVPAKHGRPPTAR
jgi:hypothetical protein